jgi:hypothetical protein
MNYSFTLLGASLSIGDSLEIMNNNSLILDEWISSIELSATNFWSPVVDFYKNSYLEFNYNIDVANSNLQNWKTYSTVVENNSSKWIQPITVFYPYVSYDSVSLNSVLSWVEKNYKINNNNENVLYVENQFLKVFCLIKQKITRANETREGNIGNSLYDYTACRTADSQACKPCNISYSGHVDCDNGDFECGGNTQCNVCVPYPCSFKDPLTNNITKTYNPYIKAILKYNYEDEFESNLISYSFTIKNCRWQQTNLI